MSAFDTNPFADPMDVNPFQVELPTPRSLQGPRPPPRGLFRQCRETWRGRDGPTAQWESELSRLAYCSVCGAVPAAGGRPAGLGAGSLGRGGTSKFPKPFRPGTPGTTDWSRLEIPRASGSNDFTYHKCLVKCDYHNPAVLV